MNRAVPKIKERKAHIHQNVRQVAAEFVFFVLRKTPMDIREDTSFDKGCGTAKV